MSWVSDYKYSWLQSLAMHVLRAGGSHYIPRHISFVMDGNRRFAKSEHIEKIEGHTKGFDRLADCLRWCLDMGIKEVTTFAFSIENYKRSQDEVDGLFELARKKFRKLMDESDKLREHGVRIRVIGNIALLPQDLQQLIAQAMLRTEQNDKLFLNVAFSYTSRDEMTQAVEAVLLHGDAGDSEQQCLQPQDICERLLEECLYTRHSLPPDLLFRTSGETRISDFLMWQLSGTVLYFTNILWPQITIWNFLSGIFAYQRAQVSMSGFKQQQRLQRAQEVKSCNFYSYRVQAFLQRLDKCRRDALVALANGI